MGLYGSFCGKRLSKRILNAMLIEYDSVLRSRFKEKPPDIADELKLAQPTRTVCHEDSASEETNARRRVWPHLPCGHHFPPKLYWCAFGLTTTNVLVARLVLDRLYNIRNIYIGKLALGLCSRVGINIIDI